MDQKHEFSDEAVGEGDDEWKPPRTFDEYILTNPLGRGGMGEVWRAEDTLLARSVAIKFIRTNSASDGVDNRFLIEARAAARVSHPNVVAVYRVGEIAGHPFIVSEFVQGISLEEMPKPVPSKRVIELGIGLARGLAAAHERGVLHRDIKPANAIVAEDGEVKLLDFGLAKLLDTATGPPITLVDAEEKGRPSVTASIVQNVDNGADTLESVDISRQSVASPMDVNGDATLPDSDDISDAFVGGTPQYMAPELWMQQPGSYRSDVYGLGGVLYHLCTGRRPLEGRSLQEIANAAISGKIPAITTIVRDVDLRLVDVIEKCMRVDPAERFADGKQLLDAMMALVGTSNRQAVPAGNPYRGLSPFDTEHRAFFFGRAAEIGTIIERLRVNSLVVLTGDSGVGKSSLCSAGVLPLVTEDALGELRSWSVARLRPGKMPIASLAGALSAVMGKGEQEIESAIREAPTALVRDIRIFLGQRNGLVVYVDQLEELITLANAKEAITFAEALFHLAGRSPSVRVLCTARSDILTRIAALPLLGDKIGQSLYLLRPLSAEKIREVITEPARVKGVSFESEALVDHLVQSMSQSASLPLLQFALAELWDARTDPRATITASALDAIGGVAGALTRHANRVLLGYSSAERDATRCILVELVTVDDARARKPESELVKVHTSARDVLGKLVQSRLLVAHEGADEASYEIAHEALLRDWDTLRLWLDEKNEYRIVERRLANAAAEWVRLGKPREGLWSERQLAEATILDSVAKPAAEGESRWEFLRASRLAFRRRRDVRRGVFFGVPTTVIFVLAMIRVITQRQIDHKVNVRLEEANRFYTAALTEQGNAVRIKREAYAAFDARDLAKGEEIWAQALVQGGGFDASLGRTLQTLEAALILDSTRTDVRTLFGRVLYDRALSAEAEHKLDTRDDLLARMALYDSDGTLQRKWSTSTSLSIQTEPQGAHVVAHRYVLRDGRYQLEANGKELGETPLIAPALDQGSYMLTITASGRANVRYPVSVDRGQNRVVSFRLPLVDEVPPGFVYIPAGHFVFGTSIDETKRKGFLTTVPAHEIESGEYFIAQHEVTYAEYIAYLRSLAPAERARRMPQISGGLVDSAFGMSELPDGRYRLVFKDSGAPLEAAEGEPLRYPSRNVRATQDWQRLPVSGITAHDAEAYATWLASTRSVPGARLCTEYEWERGARGADGREYPHGNVLEMDDGNHDETYGKVASAMGPDEVGSHPASRSPFGLDDMAGNVLEWTTSSLETGTYVIRSGAYYYDKLTACSTNRSTLSPDIRDARLGVRMCASVQKK